MNNWIDFLEKVWVIIQLTLYTIFGVAPIAFGINFIYKSQNNIFDRHYQEGMYLGLGIISFIIGLLVAWACLARGVELYRYHFTSKN